MGLQIHIKPFKKVFSHRIILNVVYRGVKMLEILSDIISWAKILNMQAVVWEKQRERRKCLDSLFFFSISWLYIWISLFLFSVYGRRESVEKVVVDCIMRIKDMTWVVFCKMSREKKWSDEKSFAWVKEAKKKKNIRKKI